jgi:hypothetical protein
MRKTTDVLRATEIGEDYESDLADVFGDAAEILKFIGNQGRALTIAIKSYQVDLGAMKASLYDFERRLEKLEKHLGRR